MNTVSMIGRVVRDPEKRVLESGAVVSNFTIAIDRYYGSKKEEQESLGKQTADFPRIVVWGKQAENCSEYLEKGSLVSIQGRVSTSHYEKDGENRYVTDIVADRVRFLTYPKEKKHHDPDFDGLESENFKNGEFNLEKPEYNEEACEGVLHKTASEEDILEENELSDKETKQKLLDKKALDKKEKEEKAKRRKKAKQIVMSS